MPFLKRANGEQSGQCIELTGEEFLIGRAPDCDLVLDPQGVSRHHARIYRLENRYVIEDLRSRNRTKVNNDELHHGRDHVLRPGDRINICDVEFIYLSRVPQAAPADEVIVTDRGDDSLIQTLDASSSTTAAFASQVSAAVKLQAVLEITRKLSSELEIDAVAPKVLDSLFDLVPMSERAFLVLKDQQTGRLIRKAFKHRPNRSTPRPVGLSGPSNDDEMPMSISRSIVNHVLDNKKAVLSQDAGNDANLPTSASIADLKIRSVMCAPLLTPDGQALGIIQLDTTASRQFSKDDLDLLSAVASQSAISIQNARLHEQQIAQERVRRDLKLAEQVQRMFLPRSVPKVSGYQFFAYYHAAHSIGGDYYDFVPLPANRLGIALADVSGKGIPAALMAAKFSGDTRYCILTENAPAPAVDALNQLLCEAGLEEKFITLSLGILDIPNGTLSLSSAGHLPVLVRRASGQVEEIGDEIAGLPLGILPNTTYQQTHIQLHPGDVVVVYSDGVTDARSPREELYHTPDHPRLNLRLADHPGTPESFGRALLQDIREFSSGQPQSDDITLICFGRL